MADEAPEPVKKKSKKKFILLLLILLILRIRKKMRKTERKAAYAARAFEQFNAWRRRLPEGLTSQAE